MTHKISVQTIFLGAFVTFEKVCPPASDARSQIVCREMTVIFMRGITI